MNLYFIDFFPIFFEQIFPEFSSLLEAWECLGKRKYPFFELELSRKSRIRNKVSILSKYKNEADAY